MSDVETLFTNLWQDYCEISPQAAEIHELLSKRGNVHNDHIALRTIDHPDCGIECLAKAFEDCGYQFTDDVYRFETKHLRARYLAHADGHPRVFISALCLDEFDVSVGDTLVPLLSAEPVDMRHPGRPWSCNVETYENLLAHSEYAAWLYAFGWRANHFTVSVNHLDGFADIADLVTFLQESGYAMNESGGLIKGSEAQLLRQASTLAAPISMVFGDEAKELPGCYVEFAQRYPDADGNLFDGFIATSADKIFESTDTQAN